MNEWHKHRARWKESRHSLHLGLLNVLKAEWNENGVSKSVTWEVPTNEVLQQQQKYHTKMKYFHIAKCPVWIVTVLTKPRYSESRHFFCNTWLRNNLQQDFDVHIMKNKLIKCYNKSHTTIFPYLRLQVIPEILFHYNNC